MTATVGSVAAIAISFGVLSGPVGASPGQEVTDLTGSLTAESLAQSLVGPGVNLSNVTYVGSDVAAGQFSGMDAVGFDSGVVLSSGQVTDRLSGDVTVKGNVVGPNEKVSMSTDLGEPGDADLDAAISRTTYDASVLEFDFTPTGSTVSFEYVFGSEEYLEYVDTNYNDVFAFYINGVNCATVGSPPVPVSVNNVNPNTNSEFYRDNPALPAPSPIDAEMDGLTTVLTCNATVTPNAPSHMKLAIADVSDAGIDSNVFIKAASVTSNVAPVAVDDAYNTTVDTPLTVPASGVLDNDTDDNDDPLTAVLGTGPAHGSLDLAADGSFTYSPDAGFVGTDTFTYTASDGTKSSDPATVTITVTPVAAPTTTGPTTTAGPTTTTEAPATTAPTTSEATTTTASGPSSPDDAAPSDTAPSGPQSPSEPASPSAGPSPSGPAGPTAVSTPSAPRSPLPLARTGASSTLLLAAGAALVVGGMSVLLVRRRRI